jgi:hypothetical protein
VYLSPYCPDDPSWPIMTKVGEVGHQNRRTTTAATDETVTQIAMTTQTDITTRSVAPRHRRGRRSLETRRRHSRERLRRQRYRVLTPLQAVTDLPPNPPLEAQVQTLKALSIPKVNRTQQLYPSPCSSRRRRRHRIPHSSCSGSGSGSSPGSSRRSGERSRMVLQWILLPYFPELFDIEDIEDF